MSAIFFSALTLGLCGMGIAEYASHRMALSGIRTRIHVSGTRGKSSVTRLIAAGLRGGGVKTAAKTTGTLPRMIMPDGSELPVFRPAGANIMEQRRIIAAAKAMNVEALVMECMALQPELHWISENKLIRATHGVITNIRPDHLDVMGPSVEDVAKAIAGMIPVRGVLYTAEHKYIDTLRAAADDRKTQLVQVSEDELKAVAEDELSGFSYIEHRENIALALRVIKDFGIDRKTAVAAMHAALPDPGVLTEHRLDFFGREIVFINAFAANDPESTEKIWAASVKKYSSLKRKIVLLNLREDRAARTVQMADNTDFWQEADKVILIGNGAYLFSRLAARKIGAAAKIIYVETESVEEIFENIIEAAGPSALVVGVGNIGGKGLPLTRFFKNRESIKEEKHYA